jgi:uncharacterized repeat protein (TIGR01451 family)
MGYFPGLWYRPANGGVYWWHSQSSAVVPAEDIYSTKITDVNQNPFPALYGATVAGFPLGTGNPGDDGVQYGVHLAVISKASNGSWGIIKVWNSSSLLSLRIQANKSVAAAGSTLVYTIKVTNNTPARQTFIVIDPIPAGTSFYRGRMFDSANNRIYWSGAVGPYSTVSLSFYVKVLPSAAGTTLVNDATVMDDALGASATLNTTVP